VVLHVGRLAPEKNIAVLAEAWQLARAALGARARFVVAGEGPMDRIIQARIPWARRLGFLERESLADLYAAADLCVLPSASETCGLVALEAMASGLPVIAADAGGLRESVRNGVNGLLAAPTDARAFAAHIVHLVMERDRRRALGFAARQAAVGRDVGPENADLLQQYRTLAEARPEGGHACAA
jgi:glycosyltransferase involved in cell wall biosynthesis